MVAPANTTYGENTRVLNITRVFDPRVIRIAAVFAIILAFCSKFACLIALMPSATIGGISLILYGMKSKKRTHRYYPSVSVFLFTMSAHHSIILTLVTRSNQKRR